MKALLRNVLSGRSGLACALCCAVPFLLAAGVVGGTGWAFLGRILPGIAVALVALAALAWWWTRQGSKEQA